MPGQVGRAIASHRFVFGGMVSPVHVYFAGCFLLIAPVTPYCDRGNGKITKDQTTKSPPPPIHIGEIQRCIREKQEGLFPWLPNTADVFMYPGSSDGKDGWWLGESMWIQTELAMDIFEHVFGPACASRFRLVANVDWSQNHAATACP